MGVADGAGVADGGTGGAGDGIFEVEWGQWVDLDDCVVRGLAGRIWGLCLLRAPGGRVD